MKKIAGVGLVTVLVSFSLAAMTPAWGADKSTIVPGTTPQGATLPPPAKAETMVVQCAQSITVQAKLDATYLQTISPTAKVKNYNDVALTITGSTAGAQFDVDCYYKSKNGDVPNIVYTIPCKRPIKISPSASDNSYWCIKN